MSFGPVLLLVAAPFFGSFFALVAYRFPAGESVLFSRSVCPSCSHVLGASDLVPVLSWGLRGGKCGYCSAPISLYYPIFEITAFLIALWCLWLQPEWLAWITAFLGWMLLALAIIDAKHFVLPDALTLPLIAAGIAVTALIEPDGAVDHVAGAVAGYLVFALLAVTYHAIRGREGLGLGDAKLLAAAGAWVGWIGLPSVVLWAAATALVFACCLGIWRGGLALKTAIPFGPFIALGLWLVWLYGPIEFDPGY